MAPRGMFSLERILHRHSGLNLQNRIGWCACKPFRVVSASGSRCQCAPIIKGNSSVHENSRNTEENKAVAFSGINFLHSKQVASNIPYLKEA